MVAALQTKRAPKTDPTKEYVAGHSLLAGLGPRVLPQSTDEVLRQIGPDTYDRMMNDPKVAAAVFLLIDAVLADGIQLIAAEGEDEKFNKRAAEVKELCERGLSQLQRPLRQTLAMMLKSAIKYGNSVAEKKLKLAAGVDKGKYHFDSIKVKPRNSFRFVVDEFMNLRGFVANKVSDKGIRTISFSSFASPDDLIDREHCMVLTLNAEDEDPRGKSSLRASYSAWNLKNLMWPEFLLWMMNCAVAGILIVLPESTNNVPKLNEAGEEEKDSSGNAILQSPAQAAVAMGQQFRNGFVAALPHGSEIIQSESRNEGAPFKTSVELLDTQITEGILYQAAATNERKYGTRSESDQKMTVMDLLIFWIKSVVEDMGYSDLLKPFVRVNEGDEAAETLTPRMSLGDTEARNWEKTLLACAKAKRDGFIFNSQLPALHAKLGLTPATPEELGQTNQPPVKEEAKGATA